MRINTSASAESRILLPRSSAASYFGRSDSETSPERSNGRTDRTPSELSDGDPLVTRRSPS